MYIYQNNVLPLKQPSKGLMCQTEVFDKIGVQNVVICFKIYARASFFY